ncbi:MAG TPA: response regulator transcription factor [Bryobacteraceae bacterium]|jgi:DNA-binding NarL/FixJ family response regulator
MKGPVRVLIVEDHFLARIALHTVLDAQPGFVIVAETSSGQDAIRLYREHNPDLVIMDLKLLGISGFDAIEAIRREQPSARILVLSNFQGSEDVYRAMRCGAHGYLSKDVDGRQLIDAIRVVAGGGRFIPKSLESRLAERCPAASITPREQEVLSLLAKGLGTTDIAEQLAVAEKTVRIHIGNLLEKLGARDRTHALVIALHRGIIHLD